MIINYKFVLFLLPPKIWSQHPKQTIFPSGGSAQVRAGRAKEVDLVLRPTTRKAGANQGRGGSQLCHFQHFQSDTVWSIIFSEEQIVKDFSDTRKRIETDRIIC